MTTTSRSNPEPVWTYRGYEMRPGEFNTAMVHLYRGEISRSNVWRQRLDATTNWAVITTGAAISVAFSNEVGNHGVIILSTILVTIFLYLEARRYRFYELWSYRVRLLETQFYAGMLVPPFGPGAEWAESLAESLLQPSFPISMWEAFGRRFRRNYVWIYLVLALAWVVKVWLHPAAPTSFTQFVERATIGGIPGGLILTIGFVFNGLLMLIGLLTITLHEASGEVFPTYKFSLPGLGKLSWQNLVRPRRRQELMVYVITDRTEAVAKRITEGLKRGVTGWPGTGMYSGQTHSVLVCVLAVTEVAHLKSLVAQEDENAFVIVTPAQEVLGGGFSKL